MDDPRLLKVAGITQQLDGLAKSAVLLRAERARISWSLINDRDTDYTVASVARDIGEPEIRFRKSINQYRNGVPLFKRAPTP